MSTNRSEKIADLLKKEISLIISNESHDVAWIPLDKIAHYNSEQSIMRMVDKTKILNQL